MAIKYNVTCCRSQ